jgi:hypothetical protein
VYNLDAPVTLNTIATTISTPPPFSHEEACISFSLVKYTSYIFLKLQAWLNTPDVPSSALLDGSIIYSFPESNIEEVRLISSLIKIYFLIFFLKPTPFDESRTVIRRRESPG